MGDDAQVTVAALVDDGEAALARGDAVAAFGCLRDACARADAGDEVLPRLALALTAAARILGEQTEALAWIERMRPVVQEPHARAALLRAELTLWSRLDMARALALEADACAAAEAIGDVEGVAIVLAMASYAAYRRGEVRRCLAIAERARALTPPTRNAQYQAVRAEMFAATASGDLETALHTTIRTRALARELGLEVDIANESNNLAETYLELGYPHEARRCAEVAAQLSQRVGHESNELVARVLGAIAEAESGGLDTAIALLDALPWRAGHPVAMIEAARAHGYWLLERGAAGDARRAGERARAGLALAHERGVTHALTALHASAARALARLGQDDEARAELERARRVADKVEPSVHALLALAAAEVLPAGDAPRHVILMNARARILRSAGRREDPHAFCAHVRHNRRLLELTGGVPSDLPGAP